MEESAAACKIKMVFLFSQRVKKNIPKTFTLGLYLDYPQQLK